PIPLRENDAATSGADLAAEEADLMARLAAGERLAVDGLAELTGRPAQEVAVLLLQLELKGRIVKRSDGTFESRA
ncbi:MAG: hypothetical protein ACO3DQ_09720, partial [Cephaloticoccus sp.]